MEPLGFGRSILGESDAMTKVISPAVRAKVFDNPLPLPLPTLRQALEEVRLGVDRFCLLAGIETLQARIMTQYRSPPDSGAPAPQFLPIRAPSISGAGGSAFWYQFRRPALRLAWVAAWLLVVLCSHNFISERCETPPDQFRCNVKKLEYPRCTENYEAFIDLIKSFSPDRLLSRSINKFSGHVYGPQLIAE